MRDTVRINLTLKKSAYDLIKIAKPANVSISRYCSFCVMKALQDPIQMAITEMQKKAIAFHQAKEVVEDLKNAYRNTHGKEYAG